MHRHRQQRRLARFRGEFSGDLALHHHNRLGGLGSAFEDVADDRVGCEVREISDHRERRPPGNDLRIVDVAGIGDDHPETGSATESLAEMRDEPFFDFEGGHVVAGFEECRRELSGTSADLHRHPSGRDADRAHDIGKDAAIAQEVLPQRLSRTWAGEAGVMGTGHGSMVARALRPVQRAEQGIPYGGGEKGCAPAVELPN